MTAAPIIASRHAIGRGGRLGFHHSDPETDQVTNIESLVDTRLIELAAARHATAPAKLTDAETALRAAGEARWTPWPPKRPSKLPRGR
jgi:hypothetical protein